HIVWPLTRYRMVLNLLVVPLLAIAVRKTRRIAGKLRDLTNRGRCAKLAHCPHVGESPMPISSRVPKGKGSETRAKARRPRVGSKPLAPTAMWGEDIVRSRRKRLAV